MPTTKHNIPQTDPDDFINDWPALFDAAMDVIDSIIATALTGVRPAAGIFGRFHMAGSGVLSFDDGVAWTDLNPADALAGIASLRTLGVGAQQAAAGNHSHPGLTADQAAAVASVRTLGLGALQAAAGNHTHPGLTADQAVGTASVRTLGTGSQQAAAGDHSHPGLAADQVAATASVRTLGSGSQQAAPGNHNHKLNALLAPDGPLPSLGGFPLSGVGVPAGASDAVRNDDTRLTPDQAAGTGSVRTLGGGALQAAPGDLLSARSLAATAPSFAQVLGREVMAAANANNNWSDLATAGPQAQIVVPAGQTWIVLVSFSAVMLGDPGYAATFQFAAGLHASGALTSTPSASVAASVDKITGAHDGVTVEPQSGAQSRLFVCPAGTTTFKLRYLKDNSQVFFSNRRISAQPLLRVV